MTIIKTEDFWQFSLASYRHEKVQVTLLQAQDTYGLNVNLALLCLYLDRVGLVLDEEQIAVLHREISVFSSKFTHSLRTVRHGFKRHQTLLNDYQKIRELLLEAELTLERQEQDLLLDTLSKMTLKKLDSTSNLLRYETLLNQQKSKSSNPALKLSDLNQIIL